MEPNRRDGPIIGWRSSCTAEWHYDTTTSVWRVAVRLPTNYDDANRAVEPDAVVSSYAEFEE